MAESRFVYVTYVRTTPEKLWRALLDPEFTRLWWCDTVQACDWRPGASWELVSPDGRAANSGQVLAIEPPRRLVLSWRCHSKPEHQEEGFSRCTFELEQQGSSVKLTIIHESDRPDSKLIQAVSGGWPLVLASLKSLLETGEALAETRHWCGDKRA
jgi:uncharacterized protein YndB with AHSA1/START domain